MGSGLVDEAKGLIYELIVRGVGVGVGGWGGSIGHVHVLFVCVFACLTLSRRGSSF